MTQITTTSCKVAKLQLKRNNNNKAANLGPKKERKKAL